MIHVSINDLILNVTDDFRLSDPSSRLTCVHKHYSNAMSKQGRKSSGSTNGNKGGRPASKKGGTNAQVLNGKPYGMDALEYQEIVEFLKSPQSSPRYPSSIRGGSSRVDTPEERKHHTRKKNRRKEFKRKCSHYTVEDNVLYRFVQFGSSKSQASEKDKGTMIYKARVARRGEVNEVLFKQFHDEKGHIGQRQGRETLRQH